MSSPQRSYRYAGFDLVRLLGMGLVTVQHVLSLLDHEDLTTLWGLSIGQVGVALFLGVSAILAVEDRRTPVRWFVVRLERLLPAYWLVVAVSFLLSWLTAHKQFDTVQVVAQLAAVGFFTHGDRLVNTPTWFVSFLLACYLATVLVRLSPKPTTVAIAVTLALGYLLVSVPHAGVISHCFTYALVFSAYLTARRQPRAPFIVLVALAVLAMFKTAIGHTALAFATVYLASHARSMPVAIRRAAEYWYEYYLVHGLVLFGAIRVVPVSPMISIPPAIVVSCVAAVLLKACAVKFELGLSTLMAPARVKIIR